MTDFTALDTPALLVDLARVDRNIAAVNDLMQSAGVGLRPHFKTSKSLAIAQRQLAAGAIGLTCSTPAEVELLGEAGVGELLWAHQPVGPVKVAFAVQASARYDLTLLVDSIEVARPLSAAADQAGVELRVCVDVDSGQHRTGASPQRVPSLVAELNALPRIHVRGLVTHEGHVGAALDVPERAARGASVGQILADLGRELAEQGTELELISVGSTPGMASAPFVDGVTEARPGTYVYFDANQYRAGSCAAEDLALTVLARVVSNQANDLVAEGRVIIDAGSKAMSSDAAAGGTGLGIVCDLDLTPLPGVEFSSANEEHGFLTGPGVADLTVGDLVRIVPNHACATVNMWSQALVLQPEGDPEIWPVQARH